MNEPLRSARLKEGVVERVAKALAWNNLNEKGRAECDWHRDFGENERRMYRGEARAAITAMREPTQEMVCAAEKKHGLLEGFLAEDGWRTMIDAALSSPKRSEPESVSGSPSPAPTTQEAG